MDDGGEPQSREPGNAKQGSALPSAKLFPMERSTRQAAVFDPKTKKYVSRPLLRHASSAVRLRPPTTPSGSAAAERCSDGSTRICDQTGDIAKSQGWTAFVLDTNGNGKRDACVEPDQPVDPPRTSAWPPASTQ